MHLPFVYVLLTIQTYSKVGKSMHTPGAQVSKSMHPAAIMCTQGAGCTLGFEHCCIYMQLIPGMLISILIHERYVSPGEKAGCSRPRTSRR